jgi:YVTN family beta-propeller protein
VNKKHRPLVILTVFIASMTAGCKNYASNGSGGSSGSGGTSNLNGVPAMNVIYPNCAPAGEQFVNSANNQLEVGGSNFVASSVVRWNGSDLPTTLDGNSRGQILTAQISASDIATAGTASVTVFNPAPGGGSSNSLTFTTTTGAVEPMSIAVDSAGKFAYVANEGCDGIGYVSEYTINPTTGALASIGPPPSSPDVGTDSVTVDPFGKFAYVANSGNPWDYGTPNGSISMYTINSTTGALNFTGFNPGGCCLGSLAVDPTGKFVYAATTSGVLMYTINSTTGALTSIGTIAIGGFPNSVAVDPTGKFAYAATWSASPGSAGNVSMFTINATTGALTSTGTITAGITPLSIAMDPTGKFAYVANFGSNDVSMYTIDTTTGILTSMGPIVAGTGPISVAVHPARNFAYVVNQQSNDVSMYAINATTGVLTAIGTIAAGSYPSSIAIHPTGKFAYVTNLGSNSVSIYSIDAATGTFTPIGTTGT